MAVDRPSIEGDAHRLAETVSGDAQEGGNPSLPIEGFRTLLDFALERGYLSDLSEVRGFPECDHDPPPVAWVRLMRLPVHPTKVEEYNLLSRWQNVLGALHAWGHRLVFLLLRHRGETHVYLGATSTDGRLASSVATEQLLQAATSQMPGSELRVVKGTEERDQIMLPLEALQSTGAVTGLPSPRETRDSALIQTLDQVAFGIRDRSRTEQDYALMVVADPVADHKIARNIHVLRAIGSELHGDVKSSVQFSQSEQTVDAGSLLRTLVPLIPDAGPWTAGARLLGGSIGGLFEQRSNSRSVGSERIDKLAEYCEHLTDRHVVRLQRGRNLGFWGTGVYVLAKTETAVHTLTGMLRSVYSGDQSYLEPIRVHLFHPDSGADAWIKQFEHVPLPVGTNGDEAGGGRWHPLGETYGRVSTALNTEELSLATSLPRRDVPGLRFVRNAVRFANNPPSLEEGADAITLGRVLDTGIPLGLDYAFDVDALVRHALITGVTGSGKSTTCRRLIEEVVARGLPMLAIEPAKDEYVRWAIEHNDGLPESRRVRIYMPGGSDLHEGAGVLPLRLNPFQPAQIGEKVDVASRCERFCSVLTASLPMTDVLPLLLEESITKFLESQIDVRFAEGDVPVPAAYPRLEGVGHAARTIIGARGYEPRVQDNLIAAVETRIASLSRGRRGQVLNADASTPFAELFERPAVVNLSQITDDRDKALIMALLVIALFEYRVSKYRTDPSYKRRADCNRLCHLTIVEEAHRLLAHPQADYAGIGNPQAVVSGMFSEMLSEIRAYGQGLLIVDQIPARLIPDAIKNTNLKIVHRLVARDDRAAMASSMALRSDQEDIIAALRRGEAVVGGDLDDAASWVKVDEKKRQPKRGKGP